MKNKLDKKDILKNFLIGVGMGSADIVPGVSGGTIAFIFGIYQRLIDSIKLVSTTSLKLFLKGKFVEAFQSIPWSFLISVFSGILIALLSLAKLIAYLLVNQPVYIWSFFFGLVIASIFIVSKRVKKWQKGLLLSLLLSSVLGFMLVGFVPVETANTLPLIFLSGVIAICAMILPGVSGSFLLIVLGKYQQILQAVLDKDILRLGIFAMGAVIGLALFSQFLSWLFAKHHDLAISVLIGFMIGSLRKVWPWKQTLLTRVNSHGDIVPILQKNILPHAFSSQTLFAIALMLLALVLMFYLSKFDKELSE